MIFGSSLSKRQGSHVPREAQIQVAAETLKNYLDPVADSLKVTRKNDVLNQVLGDQSKPRALSGVLWGSGNSIIYHRGLNNYQFPFELHLMYHIL